MSSSTNRFAASLPVGDVLVKVPRQIRVTRAVANQRIEVVHRHARAVEEARRQAAVGDILAVGAGVVGTNLVGKPRQPRKAAEHRATATRLYPGRRERTGSFESSLLAGHRVGGARCCKPRLARGDLGYVTWIEGGTFG